MSLERDTRLGKYVIRERVAGGGMGVVYRAHDSQLGRDVAIKTIHADKAADQDFVSRFKREAISIAQIDHPNIVSLIDFVEGDPRTGGVSFMVMEYLRGRTLGRLIKEGGALEITRAIDRMLEVCAAVATCHRRGYLHRDLKPGNIFITEYDHIETAKVLDFGVAKLWSEGGDGVAGHDFDEPTGKGTVFGTPEYLAPEILRGKPATPNADQYAIGVVLYAAVTGKKPFSGAPNAHGLDLELWEAIASGRHDRPRAIRPELPQGLEDAIERAIRIEPGERFGDVRALGAALLGWASVPAYHRWTALFTSAPVRAGASVANVSGGWRARAATASGPTALAAGSTSAQQQTIALPTAELRELANRAASGAGEISRATTVRDRTEPMTDNGRRNGGVSAEQASLSTVSAPLPGCISRFLRRPIALLVGGVAALCAASVTAFVLQRSRMVSRASITPPPAVFDRPSPAAARPNGAPVLDKPATNAVSPPTGTAVPMMPVTIGTGKRLPREHRSRVVIDAQGFPIPSN